MIRARIHTQFDKAKLEKKVNQATFRSLGHAGAAIRLTARRSIRRRKKPSLPGQPPHTQTGHLKRVIRYDVQKERQQVQIGPANEYSRTIWNLHEFGGVPKRRKARRSRRFKVGEFGPARVKTAGFKPTYHRIRLQTAAQASRATRLIEQETQRRATQRARYPKRPFMQPALDVNRPRLPRFWANSVK